MTDPSQWAPWIDVLGPIISLTAGIIAVASACWVYLRKTGTIEAGSALLVSLGTILITIPVLGPGSSLKIPGVEVVVAEVSELRAEVGEVAAYVSGLQQSFARLENVGEEIQSIKMAMEQRDQNDEVKRGNLEILRDVHGFLEANIATMIKQGQAIRDGVQEARLESEALLAQQLQLERELISKQTEIQMLDKAIAVRSERLDEDEPGVSSARQF